MRTRQAGYFHRKPEPHAIEYHILVCEGERLISKSTETKSIFFKNRRIIEIPKSNFTQSQRR